MHTGPTRTGPRPPRSRPRGSSPSMRRRRSTQSDWRARRGRRTSGPPSPRSSRRSGAPNSCTPLPPASRRVPVCEVRYTAGGRHVPRRCAPLRPQDHPPSRKSAPHVPVKAGLSPNLQASPDLQGIVRQRPPEPPGGARTTSRRALRFRERRRGLGRLGTDASPQRSLGHRVHRFGTKARRPARWVRRTVRCGGSVCRLAVS